ncbi:MAG TPA: YndJ family transporter [Candidatus Acidoferrum sp.]|nr:YndJ family transporter [Candidatus Acidoferrum sp.]
MKSVRSEDFAMWRLAMQGAVVWTALVLLSLIPGIHLGIIEVLFLLAPWIIVPLGVYLISGPIHLLTGTFLRCTVLPAAALATLSFFIPNRLLSARCASGWMVICAALAIDGVIRIVHTRGKSFSQFCFASGEGYLLVAGVWLVASRAGIQLIGFREPIVLLTAVHFHFAGFASAVLAGLTEERLRGHNGQKLLRLALLAVVLGPGILGLAFLFGPKWKLLAALLIVVGQIGLGVGMIRVGITAKGQSGRWLLLIAGGCVAVGMVLSAVWAMGEYPLQAFVNIAQMAKYHGVLNAVGFVLCGMLGWSQLRTVQPSQQAQPTRGSSGKQGYPG